MKVMTPGLTPHQKQRLADAVRRAGGVPLGAITTVYMDADVAAARALNPYSDFTDAEAVAEAIASEHHLSVTIAACAYGIAVGVRLGRTFAPQPKPRSRAWISEDYRQLTEPNRRDAAKYIRRLLRGQGTSRPLGRPYGALSPPSSVPREAGRPASIEEKIAAAKRWVRDIGHVAAGSQRRNKPRTNKR